MYLIFVLFILSSLITNLYADQCCHDTCVKLKDSSAYCSVITQDLQVLSSGYLNNTTLRSKQVINNEIVDGDITALGGAEFNNSLVINGELLINGSPFVPTPLEYAYFAFDDEGTVIGIDALIPFDIDSQSTAGITLNGDGSFTLATPGLYAINFYVITDELFTNFCLSTLPLSGTSNIPFTTFARTSDAIAPLLGFTIIETTVANTSIGVRNATNATQTLAPQANPILASVQILKLN